MKRIIGLWKKELGQFSNFIFCVSRSALLLLNGLRIQTSVDAALKILRASVFDFVGKEKRERNFSIKGVS